MERLLIGLRDFAIEKVVSHVPPVFEARWTGKNACPHCGGEKLRVKTHSGGQSAIFPFMDDHHACWFAAINTDVKTAADISIPDLQA